MKSKAKVLPEIDYILDVFSKLSNKQKKIFLYLSEPKNFAKTTNELITDLDICKGTYDKMNVDVRDFAKKICLAKMLDDIPYITDKFIEKAKSGSYNHGKLIFEMTGLHTPKQETRNENNNIHSVDDKTTELLTNVLDKIGS